jgi:precorrin-2 dehydrogenase/sirohydrochlorin ferrochelatase
MERNELYPIFFKNAPSQYAYCGRKCRLRKLSFLLNQNANVEVVALGLPELVDLINKHDSVKLTMKSSRKNAQEKAYIVRTILK